MINDFESSYYGQILESAINHLESNGYSTIVGSSKVSGYSEELAWKSMIENGCDGIILHSNSLSDKQLKELLESHDSTVIMNRRIAGFEHRCVSCDHRRGAALAANHLIESGHREIAMITGPKSFPEVGHRSKAFQEQLQKHGVTLRSEMVFEGKFLFESGVTCFQQLLQSTSYFTAVFAQNDEMAFGVLDVCQKEGISVPDVISVIGFDDLPYARLTTPGLTTVRQPLHDTGIRAAQLLHGLLSDNRDLTQVPVDPGLLIPELIYRDSVKYIARTGGGLSEAAETLSKRELECLHWTAAGKTSAEIAVILSVTESTVNFHIKNTLPKLNASNRAHAVAKAVSRLLISPV